MQLEHVIIIGTVLLLIVLALFALYRYKHDSKNSEGYRYEKVRNYEDSKNHLLQLPQFPLSMNPPPSQPFIPSPDQKYPIPNEAFTSNYTLNDNDVKATFYRFRDAYPPEGRMMDLPPLEKRQRMLPPGQQPMNPYSGLPESLYTNDQDINKFYAKFVPDYLWCKEGVCH